MEKIKSGHVVIGDLSRWRNGRVVMGDLPKNGKKGRVVVL
jgi:hypothetical protein